MRVKIGDQPSVHGEDEMIMVIFDNDDERLMLIDKLQEMKPREGVRILSMQPVYVSDDTVQNSLRTEAEI